MTANQIFETMNKMEASEIIDFLESNEIDYNQIMDIAGSSDSVTRLTIAKIKRTFIIFDNSCQSKNREA